MKLSKSPILNAEPLTLRATGAGIERIDMLPSKYTSALALYVSYNKISTIENITQFKSLESFLAEWNRIQYLENLLPLSYLKNLKRLRLEGNPLCEVPFWEYYVIAICKSVQEINGQSIQQILQNHDRSWAEKFSKHEMRQLKYLANMSFMSEQIKTGKYPLKNSYDDEFNLYFNPESNLLFAFFDNIRRTAPHSTPEEYIRYLDS